MYKLMFLFCIFLLCQMSYADTCPSIKDIKENNFKGWRIFDSEDDMLLSPTRLEQFRKNIVAFTLAEWVRKNKNGTIHCYYRNKDGSDMEAYLTQEDFIPKNDQKLWYQVSGAMQCAASPAKCEFKSTEKESQFAKR